MSSNDTKLDWKATHDLSIAILSHANYHVGVVAPAAPSPFCPIGSYAWGMMEDPDIEWGTEPTREEAMKAAEEAYLHILDTFGDWLPDNTLPFRPSLDET